MSIFGDKEKANANTKGRRVTLAARVAAAFMAIVVLVVSATAALSYAELRRMALSVADKSLSAQANALAADLESRLVLLSGNARTLASNSLIANALVDDLGRTVYLKNFLADFKTAEGLDLSLTVTDFEGTPIAANAAAADVLAEPSWIAEVVDDAKGRAVFVSTDDDIFIVMAEPIIYANTGTAEGALVFQISLANWLEMKRVRRILRETPWFAALTLTLSPGSATAGMLRHGEDLGGDAPAAVATAALPGAAREQSVVMEVRAFPEFVEAPLRRLLRNVALSSLGILLAAVFITAYTVRHHTRRLVRLRSETEQLSDPTRQSVHFTTEGNDEITDLAHSFNDLVNRLQNAYRELEGWSEESLRKSEDRFRSIIENSAEGILTLSSDGIIETVNPAAEGIFGYDAADLEGRNVGMLLPDRFRRDHTLYLRKSDLHSPRIINQSRDLYAIRRNGEEFPLELTVSPLEIDGQRKFVGIMRDISDRKKFEDRLRSARDDAESANRAKSRFLSSMSHELRTPLNAIMGFGQLLNTDPENPLTEEQTYAVQHILSGGGHLLELINQVLDLSKIESGTLAMSIAPVNTGPVLTECLTMAEAMAAKKGVSIGSDTPAPAEMPVVMADRTRLRQVLLNLLSNAAKYNKVGGSISLQCRMTASGLCRFSISDTGQGIPAEYQDKVFMPFNRLAAEGSTTEGTGIGLSITRQLVEQMGGRIGFSSREGEGSTFWFELPVTSESDGEKATETGDRVAAAVAPADIDIAPCSVLYVEDNPANLQLMEMILGRVGELTLHSAHTAEIGIEMARDLHPDVILMDINLPGMDGIQALRALRRDARTRDVPVIAVSANAMPHDIDAAMDAGFDAYITKPFDIPNVIGTLAEKLGSPIAPKPQAGIGGPADAALPHEYGTLAEDDVRKVVQSAKALPRKYISILKGQAATIPLLIAKIRHAVASGDISEVEATAHKLKTNSGTFGARELWKRAQQAEEMARDDDVEGLGAVVADMEELHDGVSPDIGRLLDDIERENT